MGFTSQSVSFNPERDIPDLGGEVILVTGGNAGLGKQCVLEYARHKPARIWLAGRSLQKAQQAADEIAKEVPGADAIVKVLQLDLASFESIKAAAQIVLTESSRLDILMCNAGIMAVPAALTKDGYEMQFGTNHLGHALLFKLLCPLLLKTSEQPGADVRVISLTSFGHTQLPKGGFRFDLLRTPAEEMGGYGRYFQSKLANVLWVRQLAKEFPQITAAAVHPGLVRTQLMDGATETAMVVRLAVKVGNMCLASIPRGAKGQLWASVSKDVKSGEYYEPVGVVGASTDDGKDYELAKKVWDYTEKALAGV
ncbi:hypothetical protein QBC35DRAFT_497720 [Podospora australis]|uniref:Oxidoreductase n=1 Tax=Podospora australis TaxID=1536484 RepID=A0AAN6WUV9_9PEZI|nr:hypothetical protein QBC35DRAFT_497720 [Podospora australis]